MLKAWWLIASVFLVCAAFPTVAREMPDSMLHICSWGADIAAKSQELKLTGISVHLARRKLQIFQFDELWKRMMALAITEDIFGSRARIQPAEARQTFYDRCARTQLVEP